MIRKRKRTAKGSGDLKKREVLKYELFLNLKNTNL